MRRKDAVDDHLDDHYFDDFRPDMSLTLLLPLLLLMSFLPFHLTPVSLFYPEPKNHTPNTDTRAIYMLIYIVVGGGKQIPKFM